MNAGSYRRGAETHNDKPESTSLFSCPSLPFKMPRQACYRSQDTPGERSAQFQAVKVHYGVCGPSVIRILRSMLWEVLSGPDNQYGDARSRSTATDWSGDWCLDLFGRGTRFRVPFARLTFIRPVDASSSDPAAWRVWSGGKFSPGASSGEGRSHGGAALRVVANKCLKRVCIQASRTVPKKLSTDTPGGSPADQVKPLKWGSPGQRYSSSTSCPGWRTGNERSMSA
jgi:hypothetical protein